LGPGLVRAFGCSGFIGGRARWPGTWAPPGSCIPVRKTPASVVRRPG